MWSFPGHGSSRDPSGTMSCGHDETPMPDTDTTASKPVIDVRTIPPHQRHPTIFGMIDALLPGASFFIVSDHPPRPLHQQLETRYPGQFSWDYLEDGPQVWRVEIGRLGGEGGGPEEHVCTCGGH